MDVVTWVNYGCPNEGNYTQGILMAFTCSHLSKAKNRVKSASKVRLSTVNGTVNSDI